MNYASAIAQHLGTAFLLALSCYVVLRVGQISFGQQAFFGIGAYAGGAASALLGLPLPLAFAAGAAAGAAAAWVCGLAICRASGFSFTLMTLVFAEFVREGLGRLRFMASGAGKEVGMQGPLGFSGIDRYFELGIEPLAQGAIALAAALAGIAAVLALERGRFGRQVRAVATDPALAMAAGIAPVRTRLRAFTFAGAIAGAGGALFAHHATFIEPANFGLMAGVHAVAYALLGGVGSAFGPAIGTLVDVGLLESLRVAGPYRMVAFGALIVGVLVFLPEGVLGALRRRAP